MLYKKYRFIFLLFFLTRVIYTIIGLYSIPQDGAFNITPADNARYTTLKYLNFWGKWDTKFYLDIATRGYDSNKYPDGKANYAFFPLYPTTISIFRHIFLGREYLAALFISNFSYLVGCVFLYKLALLDHDEKISKRVVRYTFLLPSAFLFSAPLSEGLFFMLLTGSFYLSRTNRWFMSGLLGFFGALTRPIGIVSFLPLVAELLDVQVANKRKFKYFLYLCMIPLALVLFGIFIKFLTGDYFSFIKVQQAWDRRFLNPFFLMVVLFLINKPYYNFILYFAVSLIALLVIYFKKLRASYWILATLMFIIPLSTGPQSILRLSLPIFPIYFILSFMTQNDEVDKALTVSLATLQGALFVAWISGSTLVV